MRKILITAIMIILTSPSLADPLIEVENRLANYKCKLGIGRDPSRDKEELYGGYILCILDTDRYISYHFTAASLNQVVEYIDTFLASKLER